MLSHLKVTNNHLIVTNNTPAKLCRACTRDLTAIFGLAEHHKTVLIVLHHQLL